MKVIIRDATIRRWALWAQRALVSAGVVALGYCAFAVADGWMFQNQARRELEQLLLERTATAGKAQLVPTSVPAPLVTSAGLIGRMEIPRLGVSAMISEGTGKTTLRRGLGHIEGTALPGQSGNVGISGHRDTYFRPLRNIRKDDAITLTTVAGVYQYRVVSTQIVKPSAVAVLKPSGTEVLTLVTCYPFYFVGFAPERFIVRAEAIPNSTDAAIGSNRREIESPGPHRAALHPRH